MPDMWHDDSDLSGFELPGDDALMGALENSEPEHVAAVENTEEVPAAEERPRDEKGRFASTTQTETTTEPELVEAEVATQAEQELILGKFKSTDDLVAAYQHLEQERGRQANEVGELRRMVEERLAAPQPAPAPQYAITQDLIDENPGAATQMAFERGDEYALRAAFDVWKDEDPAAASVWAATRQAEAREAALREAYDARLAEMEARIAPAANIAQNQERVTHVRALATEIPDIGGFIQGQEIATLAQEFPLAGRSLQSGDPAEQVAAIKTLYAIHRGRVSDNLEQATESVARATAEEAQKAREEAFVASASATAGSVRLSAAEQVGAQWDAAEKPYTDGWNI